MHDSTSWQDLARALSSWKCKHVWCSVAVCMFWSFFDSGNRQVTPTLTSITRDLISDSFWSCDVITSCCFFVSFGSSFWDFPFFLASSCKEGKSINAGLTHTLSLKWHHNAQLSDHRLRLSFDHWLRQVLSLRQIVLRYGCSSTRIAPTVLHLHWPSCFIHTFVLYAVAHTITNPPPPNKWTCSSFHY